MKSGEGGGYGQLLRAVSSLLDPKSKRQYCALAVLSVCSSLLQTLGVASISLFFTVVLGGQLPESIAAKLPVTTPGTLGILVLVCSLSGTASSALATYFGIRLSWKQYHHIASRLLNQFLENSYEWHLGQSTANLAKTVILEANAVVMNVLQQLVLICVRGSEIICILLLLLVSHPLIAAASSISFSLAYGLLFFLKHESMVHHGSVVVLQNTERQKAVYEALTGIKAIKVARNGEFFLDRFGRAAGLLGDAQSRIQYISLMPKYLVEGFLFSGLVIFMVVASTGGWDSEQSVSVLALFGAAAVRMLPAAQQIFASAAVLAGSKAALENIVSAMEPKESLNSRPAVIANSQVSEPILELRAVRYRYPNSDTESLKGVSLQVFRGEKVGVVGTTGAGKTTLIDIVLGLLTPTSGTVTRRAVHASEGLAYVPQTLHFSDDTVAANIALGVKPELRNTEKIVAAAMRARIHDHVIAMAKSYDSDLGEQGVKLSGGQRQRIGIARALYLNPELLVLDEASNALDAETERRVVSGLMEDKDLTVLVIAHRISLLRDCDSIVVMANGAIENQGTFDDLVLSSPFFKALVEADKG